MKNGPECILVVGSPTFAKAVASVLGSKSKIVVRASVSLDLFLGQWQPDMAIVDCDEAQSGVASIADDLGRFPTTPPVVWVTRTRLPSHLLATGETVVRRQNLRKQLPLALEAAWKRRANT